VSEQAAARIPGQLDVDELLALAVRDERAPAATALTDELMPPPEELVAAFVTTLVASPQTQRTYARACRRFVRRLSPVATAEDLTAASVARYHARLDAVRAALGEGGGEVVCFAGHEAGILAEVPPVGMLLVRNPAGVSHPPAQEVSLADAAVAASALARALERLL